MRKQISVWVLAASMAVAACSQPQVSDNTSVDPVDGVHWDVVTLKSQDGRLTLNVLCHDGATKIMIIADHHLTNEDGVEVIGRFGTDQNNVPKSTWQTATNEKSIIYDGDTDAFIKGLLGQPEFAVRVTPVGSDTIETSFDTSGFGDALARHSDKCGWGDLLKAAPKAGA